MDFVGNAFNNRSQVQKYLFRKASEIAMKNGYPFFKVLSGATGHHTSPDSSETWASSDTNGIDTGVLFGEDTLLKSNGNITVKLLKESTGEDNCFDAKYLLSNPID